MYGLRESAEIVQRRIEREQKLARQNNNAMLFCNVTEDILRNEQLPRIVQCTGCDGYVQIENDGELWIGTCECGNEFSCNDEEIDEFEVEV